MNLQIVHNKQRILSMVRFYYEAMGAVLEVSLFLSTQLKETRQMSLFSSGFIFYKKSYFIDTGFKS